MPFNPTLPLANSEMRSDEMRGAYTETGDIRSTWHQNGQTYDPIAGSVS